MITGGKRWRRYEISAIASTHSRPPAPAIRVILTEPSDIFLHSIEPGRDLHQHQVPSDHASRSQQTRPDAQDSNPPGIADNLTVGSLGVAEAIRAVIHASQNIRLSDGREESDLTSSARTWRPTSVFIIPRSGHPVGTASRAN